MRLSFPRIHLLRQALIDHNLFPEEGKVLIAHQRNGLGSGWHRFDDRLQRLLILLVCLLLCLLCARNKPLRRELLLHLL